MGMRNPHKESPVDPNYKENSGEPSKKSHSVGKTGMPKSESPVDPNYKESKGKMAY